MTKRDIKSGFYTLLAIIAFIAIIYSMVKYTVIFFSILWGIVLLFAIAIIYTVIHSKLKD